MKIRHIKAQRGFFDFGLAAFILASGTTTGIVKTSLHESEMEKTKMVIEKKANAEYSETEINQTGRNLVKQQ